MSSSDLGGKEFTTSSNVLDETVILLLILSSVVCNFNFRKLIKKNNPSLTNSSNSSYFYCKGRK